jgi:hypothetical protein
MAISRDIKRARKRYQHEKDAVAALLSRPLGVPLWRRVWWLFAPKEKARYLVELTGRVLRVAKKRRGKLARASIELHPRYLSDMMADSRKTRKDVAAMHREAEALTHG